MSRTIIIQRVIPHYRKRLFERLHERFGWITVAAENPPAATFLRMPDTAGPSFRLYKYGFVDRANPYRCRVPTRQIIADLQPERVISEFSLRMSVWRDLPLLRAKGKISSYAFWTHGWNMDRGFSSLTGLAAQLCRLVPLSAADLLLTYSMEGKDWLQRYLPRKKILSVGNTLDVAEIRRKSGAMPGTRAGDPQLVAIGRLTSEKRYQDLLDAFGIVKQICPRAALTIIGDGPEKPMLEKILQSRGDQAVTLLGAAFSEDVVGPHLKGADFMVLAGAAGLSVNHALAYNLPIIAFARGPRLPHHHPEIEYVIPGKTGVLCHTPGSAALARTVVEAHRSGASSVLKQSIPSFVEKHLLLDSMVDGFAMADKAF